MENKPFRCISLLYLIVCCVEVFIISFHTWDFSVSFENFRNWFISVEHNCRLNCIVLVFVLLQSLLFSLYWGSSGDVHYLPVPSLLPPWAREHLQVSFAWLNEVKSYIWIVYLYLSSSNGWKHQTLFPGPQWLKFLWQSSAWEKRGLIVFLASS